MKHLTDEQVQQVIDALEDAKRCLYEAEPVTHDTKKMFAALSLLRNLPDSREPETFPPLPHSVLRCGQNVVYDSMQMHQYALRVRDAAPQPHHHCGEKCKHESDCAVHNAPALPVGECDCKAQQVPEGDIRALKYRIHELEGEVIGYKRILDEAPQPQQVPLTDEQMWKLWNAQGVDDMVQHEAIAFARAIEAAHGIKAAAPEATHDDDVMDDCALNHLCKKGGFFHLPAGEQCDRCGGGND